MRLPRWALFAIMAAVELVVIMMIGPAEDWPAKLVVWAGFVGVQFLFLAPMLRPRARPGPGSPAWLWCGAAILGLAAGVLTAGVLLMFMDVLWHAGAYSDDDYAGVANVTLPFAGVLMLTSWGVSTPLIVKFVRKGRRDARMARVASLLFLGTVVEFLAALPLMKMADRKSRCSSETMSFTALMCATAFGFVLLGPAIILTIRARRSRAPNRGFCGACGYDMRGLESRDRCPECGAGWRPDPAP